MAISSSPRPIILAATAADLRARRSRASNRATADRRRSNRRAIQGYTGCEGSVGLLMSWVRGRAHLGRRDVHIKVIGAEGTSESMRPNVNQVRALSHYHRLEPHGLSSTNMPDNCIIGRREIAMNRNAAL
jgi:hypothetical protein